jgi:RNA polymerase sigma-70 factor (ECF subfamily)
MADGRRQALQRAVAGLPREQRDALLLRLEAGLDLDTIAKLTGVNRETAKSRLRYAVDKLKRELGRN